MSENKDIYNKVKEYILEHRRHSFVHNFGNEDPPKEIFDFNFKSSLYLKRSFIFSDYFIIKPYSSSLMVYGYLGENFYGPQRHLPYLKHWIWIPKKYLPELNTTKKVIYIARV